MTFATPSKRRSPASSKSRISTPPVSFEASHVSSNHRNAEWRRRRLRPSQLKERVVFSLVSTVLLLLAVYATRHSHEKRSQQPLRHLRHQEEKLDENALLWKNRYNVVHVIQTRFMQFQPNLVDLGWARLRLFQAVTLPSVTQQSAAQEFLWIIRTDPQLAPELRDELIASVAPYNNIILVGSNQNPEGFRSQDCIADMMPQNEQDPIWSGSLVTVQSYHEAAQSHAVLETRLDADDALLLDFVEMVQSDAAQHFRHEQDWMVWCVDNHMEWQYASPWHNTTSTGSLLGLRAKYCVTAGLTWGFGVGVDRAQVPFKSQHQQIHDWLPRCTKGAASKNQLTGTTSTTMNGQSSEKDESSSSSHCLVRVSPKGNLPAALRARTPSSAGMEHIVTSGLAENDDAFFAKQVRESKWKHSQDELFKSLPVLFGIQKEDLQSVHYYFEKHLMAILADAVEGQCTKGHSCKEGSKRLLENLLNATVMKDH